MRIAKLELSIPSERIEDHWQGVLEPVLVDHLCLRNRVLSEYRLVADLLARLLS